MPVHKSAGAVLYRWKDNKIEYFLLHYSSKRGGHWDFPKGHIEQDEKAFDTVRREVEEETGFKNIRIEEGFKSYIKYFFRDYDDPQKTVFKIVDFYIAEVSDDKPPTISDEHIDFVWLVYEEAYQRITYKKSKEILENANKFLLEDE
jgi:8-oxo-dGTP pyrophosphatase MutT (NUDIX family)